MVSFLLPVFLGIRVGNDICVLQVHPHDYGKIEEEFLAYFLVDIFMPGALSFVLTIHLYYANPLTLLKPAPSQLELHYILFYCITYKHISHLFYTTKTYSTSLTYCEHILKH